MRIINLYLAVAALFLTLIFLTPEKAEARVSVHLGYGGVHIYIGPRYRKYRPRRKFRYYYHHPRINFVRPYRYKKRYIRRKRIRRYRLRGYRYRRW